MNKVCLLILFLIPGVLVSQVVSDARIWTGVSINKKYNDFTFSLSEEIRFNENASHLDKVFTELGVEYDIDQLKGLSLGANYRFNRNNDFQSDNYDLDHRFDFSINYKKKIDQFRFSLRTKFQTKSASNNENNTTINRNKFALKYKFKNDFTPFLSYEFFYQFNDVRLINRTRFSTGTSYKINRSNDIKLFYIFENRFNTDNLRHNHIWGISYSIDI